MSARTEGEGRGEEETGEKREEGSERREEGEGRREEGGAGSAAAIGGNVNRIRALDPSQV